MHDMTVRRRGQSLMHRRLVEVREWGSRPPGPDRSRKTTVFVSLSQKKPASSLSGKASLGAKAKPYGTHLLVGLLPSSVSGFAYVVSSPGET